MILVEVLAVGCIVLFGCILLELNKRFWGC